MKKQIIVANEKIKTMKEDKRREVLKCNMLMIGIRGFATAVLQEEEEENKEEREKEENGIPERSNFFIEKNENGDVGEGGVVGEEGDGGGGGGEGDGGEGATTSGVQRWRKAWRKNLLVSSSKKKLDGLTLSVSDGGNGDGGDGGGGGGGELLSDLDLDHSEKDRQEASNRLISIQQALNHFMTSVQEFQSEYMIWMNEWFPQFLRNEDDDETNDDEKNEKEKNTNKREIDILSRKMVTLGSTNFAPMKLNTKIRPSMLRGGDMVKNRLRSPNRWKKKKKEKKKKSKSSEDNNNEGRFGGTLGETNIPVRARATAPPPHVGMWENTSLSSGGEDSFLLSPLEPSGRITILRTIESSSSTVEGNELNGGGSSLSLSN